MKLDAIVVDCADAAPLARFWAAALGWDLVPDEDDELVRLSADEDDDPEDDPSVILEPPDGSGMPVLCFTEVPEAKVTKNRLHLDLTAERAIHDEVERLESLGATVRNWAEDGDSEWAVLLDPEGNEFCVLPPDG